MENSIFVEPAPALSVPTDSRSNNFDHWKWSEMVRMCNSILETTEKTRIEKEGISTHTQNKLLSEECTRFAQELLAELLKVGIQAVKNGR